MLEFRPFFDRLSPLTRIFASALLGMLFLCSQYAALGDKLFKNYGWLLGLMITCAGFSLCYATAVFRSTFSEMMFRIESGQPGKSIQQLRRQLSDRRFLVAGLVFGAANLFMGLLFGVPDSYRSGAAALISTWLGFVVVGFICGMAAQGIYGVVRVVGAFTEEKPKLDYTDPDGCGGLRFLGVALVRFSSVTLIMGVLVSWYIMHMPWKNVQPGSLVQFLWAFWIAFPFLLSLLVLLVPAGSISFRLREFKLEKSKVLQKRIEDLRDELDKAGRGSSDQEALQKVYDYNVALRKELYKMRIWPYDLNSGIKYSSVFLANLGIAVVNADDQWHFLLKMWQAVAKHST